jgi:hypothetical protein
MSRHPPPSEPAILRPAVWSALPGELQQRAVRLLAQLAYAQLRQQPLTTTQEICNDNFTQHTQDSPRPS